MEIRKQIYPYIRQLLGKKVSKKIFFLHIPKCGGSSIDESIQNSFGFTESSRGRLFFSLDSSGSRKGSKILEDDLTDYRKRLLAYNMSINQYKYICGHFAYSEKIFQEFSKEWNFITILRHPISQWFSQYFFDIREDSEVRIESGLEPFVESKRATLMGNTYVRKLTEGIPSSAASSNEAIEQAIANLNKFALIGILERLDSFARDYKNLFGAALFIKQLNSNPVPKSKQQEQITDEIRKKVEEICQPNIKVYKSVLEKHGF